MLRGRVKIMFFGFLTGAFLGVLASYMVWLLISGQPTLRKKTPGSENAYIVLSQDLALYQDGVLTGNLKKGTRLKYRGHIDKFDRFYLPLGFERYAFDVIPYEESGEVPFSVLVPQ